jgi:hypothetical protein
MAMTTDCYKSLCELARAMEPDALEVLVGVAQRLTQGRLDYSDLHLDTDKRNWTHEELEELFDAVVYRRMRAIVAERKR